MTDLTTYTFTRIEADGEYFTDLKISLLNAVKYDVFTENQQVATLVTNNRFGYGLTIDKVKLFLTSKWKWAGTCLFFIKDDLENQVATISIGSSG